MSGAGGYPIVLELGDRPVVIVGGGEVALRKALGLLASGATNVRVVSPTFHPHMPAQVQRIAEPYRAEHLSGALLVFAATDSPQVNQAVVRDARAIGALVCRADADEQTGGDFVTPAMLRDGALLVTVSTCGSPALAAMVRDRLQAAIDPQWARLADALRVLRPQIRASIPAALRPRLFRELCSEVAMQELARGGVEALRAWLWRRCAELSAAPADASAVPPSVHSNQQDQPPPKESSHA
jgi:precorrin-2 dehydrogenase/sirohydrochlorin ferrochelatase